MHNSCTLEPSGDLSKLRKVMLCLCRGCGSFSIAMPAWTKPLAAGIKEKRTSVSSRYQGVRSVIDSGFNELRAKAQNADARPQARYQHGEPFKRIKARI